LSIQSENVIGQLEGIRLKIYCYILRVQEEVGITMVQRALGLKTASHAAYHLEKLEEMGILDKTKQNTYILNESYNTNSLQLLTLVDYYLINGRFWPKSAFLASFIVFSLLTSLVLLLLNLRIVVITFMILALLVTLVSLISDVLIQYRNIESTNLNE